MPQDSKNRIVLIGLILLFFILTLSLGSNVRRLKNNLEKERQTRLKLEERVNNLGSEKEVLTIEKETLRNTIKALDAALEQERIAHKQSEENLEEQETLNKDLEEKLEKAKRLQGILEKELKEALLQKDKAAKKKK